MASPIYHSIYTKDQIAASIGKSPRINPTSYEWEVWDISTSSYVGTGVIASDTQAASKPPIIGDNGNWYLWNGTAYADSGKPSQGADGQDGADGADGQDGQDGKSAYESAQDGGFSGTEAEFNSALANPYRAFIEHAAPTVEDLPVIADGADGVPVKKLIVSGTYDGSGSLGVTVEADTKTMVQANPNGNYGSSAGISNTGGSTSVSENVCTFTLGTIGSEYYLNRTQFTNSATIPANHRILMTAEICPGYSGSNRVGFGRYDGLIVPSFTNTLNFVAGTWMRVSVVFRPSAETTANAYFFPRYQGYSTAVKGDTIQIRNFMCVDLTAIYGTGNEPTTYSAFAADFPAAYYAHAASGTPMSKPYGQNYYSLPYIGTTYSVAAPEGIESGNSVVWDVIGGSIYDVAGVDHPVTPQAVTTILGDNDVFSDGLSGGAIEMIYRLDPTIAYNNLKNAIVSLGGNV